MMKHSIKLFTLLLILTLGLLLVRAAPGDFEDLDSDQQCQACMQQALDEWNNCWQPINDEGDAYCRSVRTHAEMECQRTFCIY